MSAISFFKWKLKSKKREKEWRERNQNNQMILGSCVPFDMIEVGNGSYGRINIINNNHSSHLKIGNYCSVAENVTFVIGADHRLASISTYPFRAMTLHTECQEGIDKGDIVIKDDVWIGYGAMILSGVEIGQGAVIAAGAVVTRNVPPYTIVGGVPAKVIRYRFKQEIIDYLLTLDYGRLDEEIIKAHVNELYVPIDDRSLEEIKEIYLWFPKTAQ